MQIINRAQVKDDAKAMVLDRSTNLIPITVMLIALTDLFSTLFNFFVDNPIDSITKTFMSMSNEISTHALNAGMQSAPDLSPAYAATGRAAQELFSQPMKRAALFLFLVLSLYQLVVIVGFQGVCLRTLRGERLGWQNLFDVLWMSGRIVLLTLLTFLLTYAGAFFLIIPGLMAYYGLRLAPFVMIDHPEWSALRCMGESWRLSAGIKMQLLWLDVSFILWDVASFFASNTGFNLGSLIHPLAATLLSLAAYALVSCIYLPYKNVSLAKYYEITCAAKPLDVSQEKR